VPRSRSLSKEGFESKKQCAVPEKMQFIKYGEKEEGKLRNHSMIKDHFTSSTGGYNLKWKKNRSFGEGQEKDLFLERGDIGPN